MIIPINIFKGLVAVTDYDHVLCEMRTKIEYMLQMNKNLQCLIEALK